MNMSETNREYYTGQIHGLLKEVNQKYINIDYVKEKLDKLQSITKDLI